ncbi:ATP-binding protein [Chryseotalea sanaruensis]|uniref:histidine kinase n=1 Tax=Chryseotalea sanaruensis TaxID=2482724 RepID=A0A401U528_9BACT|nr:tetratricopeptide repeat protein [Chryseotalea sanaruensis]GCC50017.1 ATP-binding protein [Chryseotalea sanaruensis]
MITRYFLFLLLTGWSISLSGQPTIENLKRKLEASSSDKERADILNQLTAQSWDYNFEEALNYAREAYAIASRLQDSELLVKSLTDIGMYHYFNGDYKIAKQYYKDAIAAAKENNFGDYPAYTLTRIGNLYRVQGGYDSANFFYKKSLELLKGKDAAIALSSVYHNLGWLNYELSNYNEAMHYLRQSLSLRLQIDDSLLIAESWKFMGTTHSSLLNFDSAHFYLKKVNSLASRYNDTELKIFYWVSMGELHNTQGKILDAIGMYEQALESLNKHKFKRYEAITLKRIGTIYDQLGNYEKANKHFFQTLEIEERLESKHEMARTYGLISWCFYHQGNYAQSENYAEKSLRLMKQVGDKAGVAYAQNVFGSLKTSLKDFPSALSFYDSALQIRKELGLTVYEASTLENMAYIYEAKGDLQRALTIHKQVLTIFKDTESRSRLTTSLNNIAELKYKLGDMNDALTYVQTSIRNSQSLSLPLELKRAYLLAGKIYKIEGNFLKSSEYLNKYIQINDSLFTIESISKAAQIHALYDLEKKEQQIELLNRENQIKANEIELQESKLKNQTWALIFSAVAGLLLLAVTIILFKYYINKKKANDKLQALNAQISEKQEEIQRQAEELIESNSRLIDVNHDLQEKQDEIEAQSEELREANEAIFLANSNLEKKVADRTAELRQAYLELDTFFYRSSHDFRRPLTTFMGLAEVAKITLKDPNAIHLFEKVKETAVNLDKMLMKLQSISDVGVQQLAYKEVFFKEFIDSIITSYQQDINKKAIQVNVNIQRNELFSYPSLLKIIIENLLENAINFCAHDNAVISISARQEADRFIFQVEDNGQGIDPAYKERIFDMYYRASLDSKGNGLGLYIVKKAVDKLGGNIRVESELSKGTGFQIDIPNQKQ